MFLGYVFSCVCMMEAAHAFRPGRVDIFDVRTRSDIPVLQGKDLIGANYRFRPVRYNDSSDLEVANSAVDFLLVKDVQMTGCFIQEQVFWFAIQGPG